MQINVSDNIRLVKYADDIFIVVIVGKDAVDESPRALELFLDWTQSNDMKCSTSKCKEICFPKIGSTRTFPPIHGIEQLKEHTILGVTLQNNCKYSIHVKTKLWEANKCLYIIRSLRKEGYTQHEIDHLFKALVLPKFIYALPVYGASLSDLNIIQCFLARCFKRRYISKPINIFTVLEQCDRKLFFKIKCNPCSPLFPLLPKVKESTKRLRSQSAARPKLNTERFKNCFFNRVVFKYNLAVK